MGINPAAASQANTARTCAADLREARRLLLDYQSSLGLHYKADEMNPINNAISGMAAKLLSEADALDGIGRDIALFSNK